MHVQGSVALVTGAGRGLGRAVARELVARGAATVYAGARNPAEVTDSGVVAVPLDITDAGQIAAAAQRCADVSLLVNNAGVMLPTSFIGNTSLAGAHSEMQVNYFGTLDMCRAFAAVLAANGGGALVNMLSVTSFFSNPLNATYGASKAAEWALTNGVRTELAHQGTLVVGVHASFIDTDMAAGLDVPKVSPQDVARQLLDAVEAGQVEVLADQRSKDIKAQLSRDQELIYPDVRARWAWLTGQPIPGSNSS